MNRTSNLFWKVMMQPLTTGLSSEDENCCNSVTPLGHYETDFFYIPLEADIWMRASNLFYP